MKEIALVHLVWQPAGLEPFRQFLSSYQEQPAGIDHTLLVVYNGFSSQSASQHRDLASEFPHQELHLSRPVRDIEAYFQAAHGIDARYVCFVNSYSMPLADGWLRMLHEKINQPGIGAVGATGSWESLYTNHLQIQLSRTRWTAIDWAKFLPRQWRLRRYRADFAPAPTPHLRSNSFMIERSRWLALRRAGLRTKWGTWRFESGREGMTSQLREQGLEVTVVGRNGVGYAHQEWPESHSFRMGVQANLLVADNRTRQYDNAPPDLRAQLGHLAWGAAFRDS